MFGDSARRLAGVAAQWLGWTPETFWNATPTELSDALALPCEVGGPPEQATIDALMKRFPDQRR
jgi:uncharacterized phage protein (TIGR02216 family)